MDESQDREENNLAQRHVTVLRDEVCDYLELKKDGIYVDGTLGLGGHSEAILQRISQDGCIIGIDRDTQTINLAKARLKDFSKQCSFINNDIKNLFDVLTEVQIEHVDGIVLDLGISSVQLDTAERGFSLKHDGPLDMRMNQDDKISAFDLVNSMTEKELSVLIRDYGEERFHGRIARKIVAERTFKPIETTAELRNIIIKAMPAARGRTAIHPATRTFQALRIAVNRELESLEEALEHCIKALKPKGRLAVIAFHSLEDRIVKQKFNQAAKQNLVKLIFKKPLRPQESEIENNPRARSARLRVVERLS